MSNRKLPFRGLIVLAINLSLWAAIAGAVYVVAF